MEPLKYGFCIYNKKKEGIEINNTQTIREQLLELTDEKYRVFASSLLPGVEHILGVRLPELRKIAKKITKGDWKTFLETTEEQFFEEVMLQGMVIGAATMEVQVRLNYMANFIPKIDCWSVCDSFCSGLKFTQSHKEIVWEFLKPYIMSEKEYEIRFAVVMLLNYYVTEEYAERAFIYFEKIKHDGYYVKMAVAWAISVYYTKLPVLTMKYLKNNNLDHFTYHKALQKITESLRVDKETKMLIREMKANKK